MNTFNSIRLRSYLEHLTVGAAALFIGGGILYGIIEEMVTSYLEESYLAYILGIVASGFIIAAGIIFVIRAFYMDKKMFVHLDEKERQTFFKELGDDTTMIFGHRLIITKHFILVYARYFRSFVHIWRIEDLTACYGRAIYAESPDKPDGYRLVLSDNRFSPIACVIKGDSALVMDEACNAIVSLAPWVFTDNYQEFMDDYTRRTKKKAFMREIEHRKAAVCHSEVDDVTIPMAVVTAADIIKAFNEQQKVKARPKINPKAIFYKKSADDEHTS